MYLNAKAWGSTPTLGEGKIKGIVEGFNEGKMVLLPHKNTHNHKLLTGLESPWIF